MPGAAIAHSTFGRTRQPGDEAPTFLPTSATRRLSPSVRRRTVRDSSAPGFPGPSRRRVQHPVGVGTLRPGGMAARGAPSSTARRRGPELYGILLLDFRWQRKLRVNRPELLRLAVVFLVETHNDSEPWSTRRAERLLQTPPQPAPPDATGNTIAKKRHERGSKSADTLARTSVTWKSHTTESFR